MKIWISFFMIFSSVLIFSQDKKSIKNFIISFLEYEKNNLKNNHEEVLILAIDSSNACEKCSKITISYYSKHHLKDFPYKKVFLVGGFKMIVYENDFSTKLNDIYKELPFENFNLSEMDMSYNPITWTFVFNENNEIEIIYGLFDKDFSSFLKKKKLKLSKALNPKSYTIQ